MKDLVKKLFIIQVKKGGIPEEDYQLLLKKEQKLLHKVGDIYSLKDEYRGKIKVVLTGGVFDLLHIGHLYTLSEAKKHGDVLVVAIAKDKFIETKGRKPIHSQEYRMTMVEFLKPVDLALLGMGKPKDLLETVRPDVIVYGYDQKKFLDPDDIEVVRLDKRVEEKKFKTSKILLQLGL